MSNNEMRFDRILAEILEWINNVLWSRELEHKPKPYEKIGASITIEGFGILYRVLRPVEMCPRAVSTIIFQEFRYEKRPYKDLHFCVDHLEGMHQIAGNTWATHRVVALRTDHFIGKDGKYAAVELFSIDDDLQGQAGRRDVHVNCILLRLARSVAVQKLHAIDWIYELDSAKKACMGDDFTHTLRPVDTRDAVYAYPLDGGKKVKIKLGILIPFLALILTG